jgi:heptosyltransferase-3
MAPDAVDISRIQRALVVKLRHHGDILLTSPAFQTLKNRAPRIEIDALIYHDTREMLALHPATHTVHTIDRDWKHRGALSPGAHEWALLRSLVRCHCDLVVHLTDHPAHRDR